MARRPLSDQRRLLVELELDEAVVAGPTRRPQSAPRRRATGLVDVRTSSPYKFKQKVLSSRHGLEDNDAATVRPPAPTARRQRPPTPSPLVLIADAIRENAAQRSRVLLDVQDELRRIPPLRRGPTLLSSKAIKMLNRVRSLTLSIVEMVRYFHEQLASYASAGGDATIWALLYEFQELFSRLSASDVDVLASFPPLVLFLESLGGSAMRNPFLDGVSLDSSELLLCSCQALGSERSRSVVSSSLFQLVVSRLEAFALQVHRQYPAWQTLPHDRVAQALLDLLGHENKVHATRLLPSYLRPEGSQWISDTHDYRYSDHDTDDEDDDTQSEDTRRRAVAWDDSPLEPPSVKPAPQPVPLGDALKPSPKPSPRSIAESLPPAGNVLPAVAEPKAHAPARERKPRASSRKAKRMPERSMTMGALDISAPPIPVQSETKQGACRPTILGQDEEAVEPTHVTIAHALDKLPRFSMRSLGIESGPEAEATTNETGQREDPPKTPILNVSTQTLEHSETQTESATLVSASTDARDAVELVSSSTDPPEPAVLVSSATGPPEPVLLVTSWTDPPEPVALVSSATDPPEPVVLVSTSTDPPEPVVFVSSSTDPAEPVLLVSSSADPPDSVVLVSSSTDPPEPVVLVSSSTDPPEQVELVSSWTDPPERATFVDSSTDPPGLADLKSEEQNELAAGETPAPPITPRTSPALAQDRLQPELVSPEEEKMTDGQHPIEVQERDRGEQGQSRTIIDLEGERLALESPALGDVAPSTPPEPESPPHPIQSDSSETLAAWSKQLAPIQAPDQAADCAHDLETAASTGISSLDDQSSERSRILLLCRDVQVAAIDLNERLKPYSDAADAGSPLGFDLCSPLQSSPPCSRTFTLSTRYLERELKMLRRCFRLWVAALVERHERLRSLRVACLARRIGRFGRLALAHKRERERIREHQRREQCARVVQRQWGSFCEEQRRIERRRAFHELHRRFHRIAFFTRVGQRTRRRLEARVALQRWWRRMLRALRAAQNRRREQEQLALHRRAAARHLQGFVREQLLRRRLDEALETNRRLHMMDNLRAMKARQDETKRRQLEAKRLAELKATMQLALREMETRWKEAEQEKRRVCEDQAQRQAQEQQETEARRRALASERIRRFLELGVLRRRLKEAAHANAAIAEAQRELSHVRLGLERRCRRGDAERLLLARMLWWKMEKRVAFERWQASEHVRLRRLQQASERDEARQKLHAQLRSVVAQSRVEAYCGAAQSHVVETTYAARLSAKHDEAQRLQRQAARERIAGFVQHNWMRRLLQRATDEAAELSRLRQEADEKQALEIQRREEEQRRRLRLESERIVAAWVTNQAIRVKEKRVAEHAVRVETLRRVEAERERERLRAENEQLVQQSRRRERQRLLEIERRVHARLVETMVDTQRLAGQAVSSVVSASLAHYDVALQGLVLTAQFKRVVVRAWAREACWRWRQFVLRRRAIAAITSAALWPSHAVVSIVHDVIEQGLGRVESVTGARRRELRLFELKCIASARKIQRSWGAWRKRTRQRRRLEVKRPEDALVAESKASPVDDAALERAVAKVARWFRVKRLKNEWRRRVADDENKIEILFAGGRAWPRRSTTTLRCDRAVTRKLLQALEPATSTATDVSRVLHELSLDLSPIFETASSSPRTMVKSDGSLALGDVDEMELPRFSLVTRQLGKTRSMLKRTQLLDAKAAASSAASSLTIWDAVEAASMDDAQFLLLQGADVHAREPCHQRTALHMLAFSGELMAERVGMLQFLVAKAKLDVHARDSSGDTPLMLFAARGCVGLVDALMQAAPSQDLWRGANAAGRTALHHACDQDQPEAASLLQQAVLMTAISEEERRELLVELYGPDASGASPIHTLAVRGHVECLRQLLSAVDEASRRLLVDRRDADGLRPLHLAGFHGHVDVARLLLDHGASVATSDAWQRFPLHFATHAPNAVDVISLLVECSADVDAADERGDSALHWAAAAGKALVVRHLLVLGANPTVLNGDWESPAQVAASYGHAECRRMLLPAPSPDGARRGDSSTFARDPTQEAASAKSYCLPNRNESEPRARGHVDWDEIHRDVELVEESGAFSSEDEQAHLSSDDE